MTPDPQSICITGAGTGLGAGLARLLANPRRHLFLHYFRSRENAESLAGELKSKTAGVTLIQADLQNEAGARSLKEAIATETERLDVLINNAGIYHQAGLMELTEAQWQTELHTTASAAFFTTRALVPLMKKAGHAHVINIGDSSCDRPGARDLAVGYHIGKTGVLILTKSFARELAPHQISVNMISPGYLENSVGLPDPSCIPAGRFGTFEDIASAAESLISRPDAILTGSNLILSGGWNLR